MKTLLLFFSTLVLANAISQNEIMQKFQEKDYKSVCQKQVWDYAYNKNNEAIMSIYGFSCLKIHNINHIAAPAARLRKSKEARQNSAYFANILLKKKLLYLALVDGVDISYFRLAKSDYILSMIFDRYIEGRYEKIGENLIFSEENSDTFYELETIDDGINLPKLILRTYKNNEIISQIEYY
ncbi:MAG: hypothetical protein K5978_04585 [Campylobacter sp.]|nr:hypothetical protein [Campylobacter sp.]